MKGRRRMAQVKVDYKVYGMVQTNCYFVCNEETMETVIIDPADNVLGITGRIEEKGYIPKAVFLTHGHFDHILAAKEICKKYGIKCYGYRDEAEVAESPGLNLSTSFMGPFSLEFDETFEDGEKIQMAGMEFKVIHTPGHTKGSCCYYLEAENILISGDTLFNESVGRTDFPTGSASILLKSIKEKLFVLPDETVVYPGHGDATTIGYEKVNNCCVDYI